MDDCPKVRASVVAVTLDLTEEELFFQFGMDNWSAYVDQVLTAPHCRAAARLDTNACISGHKMCVKLLAKLELLHVDARKSKLAMFCLH